jgi:hypothetical protein
MALLTGAGGTDSALAASRRVTALYEQLARENPADTESRRGAAVGYTALALIQSLRLDQPDSAVVNVTHAGELLRALAASDPDNQDFAVSVALAEASEGQFLALVGRDDEAAAILEALIPRLEAWAAADTTDTRYAFALGEVSLGLGIVEMQRARAPRGDGAPHERWASARAHLERARTIHERQAASGGWQYLVAETGARIDSCLAACDAALRIR